MRTGRLIVVVSALALAGLTACVPRAEPPAPTPPPPALSPAPALPSPPPAPAPADWSVAPLTPGDWARSGSEASYGGAFALRCEAGRVTLSRLGAGAGQRLTIRTSYGERSLPASSGAATLAASDPLLDQIAFSRGRFLVQADGLPPLILPAWPEPARVIEDCRG